ncbi:RNA methyltransferase [Synechococcus sp. CS-1328]|uniref:RNA methyltransferase n=1 Tax=Synechococcus sp. CS-1328 TaxID=2847976 RepID=UPI00223BA8AA|nr:TrmJ/YjtD family RNA methyltransferase [Synechococcus sp. CS-1328]
MSLDRPSIAVVLVEPAGPLNVGSVARLCANFGVDRLRLVAPRCDPLGEEAVRMAVHGRSLLEAASRHSCLAEALADCRRVVATSGRLDAPPLPLLPPGEALRWLLVGSAATAAAAPSAAPAAMAAPLALVFGREDRGLSNDELLQAGRLLQIGTGAAYASLNLSHAVAVVLHELHGLRSAGEATPSPAGAVRAEDPGDPATRAALEASLADAEELLLEVGFLYPHTAHARMAKVRALLQRAQIDEGEVALLRGMVRQLRWASRRGSP